VAVKRRKQKKKEAEELWKKAVKIKCCYCDLYNTCDRKHTKMKSEKMGITTYCTITPNRPKSFNKSQKNNSRNKPDK
jgi:hypothetical protein